MENVEGVYFEGDVVLHMKDDAMAPVPEILNRLLTPIEVQVQAGRPAPEALF